MGLVIIIIIIIMAPGGQPNGVGNLKKFFSGRAQAQGLACQVLSRALGVAAERARQKAPEEGF